MNEIIPEKILKMKNQPGKDMVIFGSGSIVAKIADNVLIDEYWIIVAPVALGKGRALFAGIKDKLNLKLFETKRFQSGNILLKYQPGI